jgi:hypothetical protein
LLDLISASGFVAMKMHVVSLSAYIAIAAFVLLDSRNSEPEFHRGNRKFGIPTISDQGAAW